MHMVQSGRLPSACAANREQFKVRLSATQAPADLAAAARPAHSIPLANRPSGTALAMTRVFPCATTCGACPRCPERPRRAEPRRSGGLTTPMGLWAQHHRRTRCPGQVLIQSVASSRSSPSNTITSVGIRLPKSVALLRTQSISVTSASLENVVRCEKPNRMSSHMAPAE